MGESTASLRIEDVLASHLACWLLQCGYASAQNQLCDNQLAPHFGLPVTLANMLTIAWWGCTVCGACLVCS